ncbi:GspH/FimT family pseudopilin [Neptuniibacter marinus]|uniref:GspH/FimT family pseudopilin n=1 Tax=Neptuniibacter marinus TaxID=1806670 RepID=UPI00082CF539|nr:GspH/FimT family pseudopilin [Neptuniibacter marinus]
MSEREKGFTLLELMIAIVILGIILGLGVPSYNSITESSRLRAATHSLNSAIQLARSEALTRRETAAACRSNLAFTACEFGADWSRGWMVVTQQGADLETAADVTVIRIWDSINLVASGAANGFVFDRLGRGEVTGALRIQNDTDHRCLSTNVTGRTAVQEISPGDSCP